MSTPATQVSELRQLEQHRPALVGHCYRMMGSATDADDAVQETMLRAWRSMHQFDGRSSLRTWLYRVATNVCLDMLNERQKRNRPMEVTPVGTIDGELDTLPRTHWLEPVPDASAIPGDADPAEAAILRQSIRLAFVAALQLLPPKQRAALLLAEVLGWSAIEISQALDTSVAAVNSALQRARATLATRAAEEPPAVLTDEQEAVVQKYMDAFLRFDVDTLTSLLREDAVLSMPPFTLWLQGPEAVRGWLHGRGAGCNGSKLVRTSACGLPAFGQYRDGGKSPWALIVLELSGTQITHWNAFLDTERLFPLFGLPKQLP